MEELLKRIRESGLFPPDHDWTREKTCIREINEGDQVIWALRPQGIKQIWLTYTGTLEDELDLARIIRAQERELAAFREAHLFLVTREAGTLTFSEITYAQAQALIEESHANLIRMTFEGWIW